VCTQLAGTTSKFNFIVTVSPPPSLGRSKLGIGDNMAENGGWEIGDGDGDNTPRAKGPIGDIVSRDVCNGPRYDGIVSVAGKTLYNDENEWTMLNGGMESEAVINGKVEVSAKNVAYLVHPNGDYGNIPYDDEDQMELSDAFEISAAYDTRINAVSKDGLALPLTTNTMALSAIVERLERAKAIYSSYGTLTPANIRLSLVL
jgi:hypothetical protein